MKDPRRFYTYAYLRENKTPYYVGKGEGRRAYSKKHRVSVPSLDRILFLKRNLLEKDAIKHEEYMIALLGRKDNGTGILRNLTDGGEGISGFKHSKETKIKIANAGRNRTHTEETKIKLSELNVGKKLTEEAKRKIKEKRANQVFTEETRKKLSDLHKGKSKPHFWKKFKIISPDGNIVEEDNLTKFCIENNLNYSCISRVLCGKQKQHKGWTKQMD